MTSCIKKATKKRPFEFYGKLIRIYKFANKNLQEFAEIQNDLNCPEVTKFCNFDFLAKFLL